MKEITVDVIIPVYRPGERFGELLKRLEAQTRPVNRYIIMNTELQLVILRHPVDLLKPLP